MRLVSAGSADNLWNQNKVVMDFGPSAGRVCEGLTHLFENTLYFML